MMGSVKEILDPTPANAAARMDSDTCRAGEERPFGAGLGLGLALSIPFWLGLAIALLR